MFNMEDVESATQHFSEVNFLGRSNYSAVYKGVLRDGSIVAIKRIAKTCFRFTVLSNYGPFGRW